MMGYPPMTIATTPEIEALFQDTETDEEWKTVLHNCNCHTFDAVIAQLMWALPCGFSEARRP